MDAGGDADRRLRHADRLGPDRQERRLTARVASVAERQTEHEEVMTGPPVSAAFKPDGEPTPAAIGFSSGGMTLLHLATRHPDRLSKMVVVGATTHFGEQARKIMRAVAAEGLPPPVHAMFEQCAARGKAQAAGLVRQFSAIKDSHDDMNF